MIVTKSVELPALYIANMSLGQCVGHPPVEVDNHLLLSQEAMHRLLTKRGVDVKHASCVEARVDKRSEDMKRQFASAQ